MPTTKQPIRVRFSRRLADGTYENVPSVARATGMNVFRNDATAKQFAAGIKSILDKFEGVFVLHSEETDRAVLKRVGIEAVSLEQLMAMEVESEDDLPF